MIYCDLWQIFGHLVMALNASYEYTLAFRYIKKAQRMGIRMKVIIYWPTGLVNFTEPSLFDL